MAQLMTTCYGVASISKLLKIIGLFCRIWSLLQGSFAKETYNLKEPTIVDTPYAAYAHILGGLWIHEIEIFD